jgi:hypothetical protein
MIALPQSVRDLVTLKQRRCYQQILAYFILTQDLSMGECRIESALVYLHILEIAIIAKWNNGDCFTPCRS